MLSGVFHLRVSYQRAITSLDQFKKGPVSTGLLFIPHSFVEGAGFRAFMSTISPEYNKLSQRTIGLQLYDEVERTIKPQLIRDLKACLGQSRSGETVIHVTLDLWAGEQSSPVEEPIIVVQLHFISSSWQVRHPIVAFRHLSRKNLSAAVADELEGVLLSYGVFPPSIGYVLTNEAKVTLAQNNLFCDYKMMSSNNRGEVDGDEMVAYLSDQMSEAESPFSGLKFGSKMACVANMLQLVIRGALKNSRVVENLLLQVNNVVGFFRRSAYWTEVREISDCIKSYLKEHFVLHGVVFANGYNLGNLGNLSSFSATDFKKYILDPDFRTLF